jgi:hypothetical protein
MVVSIRHILLCLDEKTYFNKNFNYLSNWDIVFCIIKSYMIIQDGKILMLIYFCPMIIVLLRSGFDVKQHGRKKTIFSNLLFRIEYCNPRVGFGQDTGIKSCTHTVLDLRTCCEREDENSSEK